MNVNINGIGIGNYQDGISDKKKTKSEPDFGAAFADNLICGEEAREEIKPGTAGINVMARNRVVEDVWKETPAVKKTAVRYVVFEEDDYTKPCPADGYLYKTKVDLENNRVYVEKRCEDGTVEAYEVDVSEVNKNPEQQTSEEFLAIIAWGKAKEKQEKREEKEAEDPFKRAVDKFSVFVKERIKNGDIKIPIGGEEFSEKEWGKLLRELDGALDEIKKSVEEQAKEAVRQAEERKKNEAARQEKLMEKLRTDNKAPYSWLADDNNCIIYNGVTFFCDSETRSINLGDVSNRDNVLSIPLSGGGTLNVNRDNIEDLAKAIDMFSPEDVKRILQAIATDAQCKKKLLEIEEEKLKIY